MKVQQIATALTNTEHLAHMIKEKISQSPNHLPRLLGMSPVNISTGYSQLKGDVNEANDQEIHECLKEFIERSYSYGIKELLQAIQKATPHKRKRKFSTTKAPLLNGPK